MECVCGLEATRRQCGAACGSGEVPPLGAREKFSRQTNNSFDDDGGSQFAGSLRAVCLA